MTRTTNNKKTATGENSSTNKKSTANKKTATNNNTTSEAGVTTDIHAMAIVAIDVNSIFVPERKRDTSDDAIKTLANSMRDIGHLIPITIRFAPSTDDAGEEQLVPTLVAGAHRLAAAKKLGWPTIDCMTIEDDRDTAELCEIAENLHRLDLSGDQRAMQIQRYAAILEQRQSQSGQNVPIESKRKDGRGHRPKGIAKIIAEETGMSPKTVYRALKEETGKTVKPKEAKTKPKPKPKTSSEAARTRLQKAWDNACQEDRDWFLDMVTQP